MCTYYKNALLKVFYNLFKNYSINNHQYSVNNTYTLYSYYSHIPYYLVLLYLECSVKTFIFTKTKLVLVIILKYNSTISNYIITLCYTHFNLLPIFCSNTHQFYNLQLIPFSRIFFTACVIGNLVNP